ncbi:MAG: hypothetical protein JWM19_2256 [Actinomycetia bacterium]|nr:hypothetical protein [Actinomycetes bacterium]
MPSPSSCPPGTRWAPWPGSQALSENRPEPSRAAARLPSRCWCGSAASTARSPTSRWMTYLSPRRRSATPPPKTTSGLTLRSRWKARERNSRSASARSASCVSRSAPRPSPTWPTQAGRWSSPGCRARSSPPGCGAFRSRSAMGHRQQPGDLPCLAWQVGDRGSDPRVRALRRRREHPGQLHVHAGRALPAGWPHARCQGRWPDSRRGRRGEPAA